MDAWRALFPVSAHAVIRRLIWFPASLVVRWGMGRGLVVAAVLLALIGCRDRRQAGATEKPASSTGVGASGQAVSNARRAKPDACPIPEGSVLSGADLDEAARHLVAEARPAPWVRQLSQHLGVECAPSQRGFQRAVAAAIAAFERSTLPFTTEVDGKLDPRTERFLQMMFPGLRGDDHPCHSRVGLPLAMLSEARRKAVRELHGSRAGKTAAWVRRLQRVLGMDKTSGTLDDDTLRRLAGWQRIVGVVKPAVRPLGKLDEPTLQALARAFPSLAEASPDPDAPLRFLPACVVKWKDADASQKPFMRHVYEAQRVWAAQRRTFVGRSTNATAIEDGRTANRDAALAARRMLTAARASAKVPKSQGYGGDLKVVFGYRSAAMQVVLWEYHFPERYRRTAARRDRLPGGPHGHDAVVQMASYYAARTASPGYSLHNRGLAVDLVCVTPKRRTIGATGRFVSAWKTCWCHEWLDRRAADFGFRRNRSIDEPWHWEYHTP